MSLRPTRHADQPESSVLVRVLPEGVDIIVEEGESLMAAAQRQGYYWPTRCRGQAICTACAFEILIEDEDFSAMAPRERDAVESLGLDQQTKGGRFRLACQVRPVRDTTVFKRGIRPAEKVPLNPGLFF